MTEKERKTESENLETEKNGDQRTRDTEKNKQRAQRREEHLEMTFLLLFVRRLHLVLRTLCYL